MAASPNVSSSSSSNEPPPAHARKSSVNRPALNAFVRRAKTRIGLTGQVNFLLADDATLRNLNREYRGKDKATDILSFSGLQIEGMPETTAGDLAVSLDTAARQAAEHGHSLQTEVKILLLHGLLHLAGFDHETDAGEMRQREAELRACFRLPAGLITRSER